LPAAVRLHFDQPTVPIWPALIDCNPERNATLANDTRVARGNSFLSRIFTHENGNEDETNRSGWDCTRHRRGGAPSCSVAHHGGWAKTAPGWWQLAESINADVVGAYRAAFERLGARYLRFR
jgi:hypothetical protein